MRDSDQEYFASNPESRLRVRGVTSGDVPGGDPDQAVLVARVAPGQFMRHVLPDDVDMYADASEDDLQALAEALPHAVHRKDKRFMSFHEACESCSKRMKSKARKAAMEE